MSRASPTLEGFRTAFRRPSLTLAETTWRWAVGATATVLFFFGLFEYLNSLPITRGEMLFLRTRQPYLVGQAILHILRGSLNRAVISALVAALLIAIFWIIAGAVGRIATLRFLLEYFRERFPQSAYPSGGQNDLAREDSRGASRHSVNSFEPLVSLNFLRVAVALASLLGFVAAVILASFASPKTNPNPGFVFVLLFPLIALISLVWWALNWLLSLATVFAVRDGKSAARAISAAVSLCRARTGAVFAVNSWIGLAHLVAFVGATTVVSIPLAFIPLVPWRLVLFAVILITLAYLVIADWLYMARLAGFVCIAEMPEQLLNPLPPTPVPPVPLQTAIDREELILSDIPNLAVEM